MRKFSITNDTGISKEYQASSLISENDPSRNDINADIVCYPQEVFSRLTQIQIDLLNYIFWLDNNHINIWVSQDRMARHVGITREHVNRLIAQFVELKLITSQKRGWLETNIYTISNYFRSPQVRHRLMGIFVAFSFMPFNNSVFRNGEWIKRTSNLEITLFNNKSSSKVNISLKSHISRPSSNRLSDQVVFALANGIHVREIYYPSFINESMNVPDSIQQVICDSKGKAVQESPIRESIRDLKSLSLTKWGQIELMKFPDLALQHAVRTLILVKPRDPFIYFLKICNDYCKSNGIRPDYSLTQALLDKYKRPEKYSYTIPLVSGSQFATSIVNGFSAYSARSPESAKKYSTPQRNQPIIPDRQHFTMDQILARKEARHNKANEKLVSNGQQALPFVGHQDPFSMDDSQRKSYFSSINRQFLVPLLKLGLNSPNIESHKKLMILKTTNDLNLSLEGIITPQQIERLISSCSPDMSDPGTMTHVDGHDQYTI